MSLNLGSNALISLYFVFQNLGNREGTLFAVMNIVIIISLSLNIFLIVALCGQGCKSYRKRKCSCPSRPAPVLSGGVAVEVPPAPVNTNDTTVTTTVEDISTVSIEEEKGERPKAATNLRGILKR